MPRVSVIIPTFNQPLYLKQAVESVIAQSMTDLEIIVVDDGSTDDTTETLSAFGDQVKVIRQSNLGVSAARNRGILESQGEFIAFLDHDDIWLPNKLERQLYVFASSPEVGIVYCNYSMIDTYGESIEPIDLEKNSYYGEKPSGHIYYELLSTFYGRPSTVMVRRDCFSQAGLFDPLVDSIEDWDMWLRLARWHVFQHIPELLVQCRFHPHSHGCDTKKVQRAFDICLKKHIALDGEDSKAMWLLRRTRRFVPSEQRLRHAYQLQAKHQWHAALPYLLNAVRFRPELVANPFYIKCLLNSLFSRSGQDAVFK